MAQTEIPPAAQQVMPAYDSTRLILTKDDFQKIDSDQSNTLSLVELVAASKSGNFTGDKLTAIKDLAERIKREDIPNNRVRTLADIATQTPPEIPNWHDPKMARQELSKNEFMLIDTNNDGVISASEMANAKNLSPMKQHAVKVLSESNFHEPPALPLEKRQSLTTLTDPFSDDGTTKLVRDHLAKSKPKSDPLVNLFGNSAFAGVTTATLMSKPVTEAASSLFRTGGAVAAEAPALAKGASESLVKSSFGANYQKGFWTSFAAGGVITADHMAREQMYGADAKSWETSSLTVPLAIALGGNLKQKAALAGVAVLSGHGIDNAIPAPDWIPDSLKHFTTYDAIGIGVAAAIPSKNRVVKAALMTTGWLGGNSAESFFKPEK